MNRVHGEQRASHEGRRQREDGGGTPRDGNAGEDVQQDVDTVEEPWRALPRDPFEREEAHDDGAISVRPEARGPVGLSPQASHPLQVMHEVILEDHVPVVVREVVTDAGAGGDQRQQRDDNEHGTGTVRRDHRRTVNFTMCQSAATPSRQLIFFPSA